MRNDEKNGVPASEPRLETADEMKPDAHVVFDFTGLEEPDVCDLSLILTARLQSAPGANVWVRSLPWQTAKVLRALRLDHLFRRYPRSSDQMN